MTRFNKFSDDELDAMELAFCNVDIFIKGLKWLVKEIQMERNDRERQNEEKEEWEK